MPTYREKMEALYKVMTPQQRASADKLNGLIDKEGGFLQSIQVLTDTNFALLLRNAQNQPKEVLQDIFRKHMTLFQMGVCIDILMDILKVKAEEREAAILIYAATFSEQFQKARAQCENLSNLTTTPAEDAQFKAMEEVLKAKATKI